MQQFTLKNEIHPKTQQYKQEIIATESVSLHVRHGDYVTNADTNSFHGVCSLDYYKNAVSKIKQEMPLPFFIFSDDIIWAKENLDFIGNMTFIEYNGATPDHEEMYLMSLCQHNIIANSSFSWWGAWLNQNPNKIIIAPQNWFNDVSLDTKDLIPNEWIRL